MFGFAMSANSALADRTSSVRTSGPKNTGTRSDITVPYTTSGKSAFMSGSVAPKVLSSPVVNDPANPQAKPVYNIPFYGAKQSFGGASNGATSKP